jgi:hypothetical protein
MLIGNKTRARPVPGGRTVERSCDECEAVRTFTECEVADKVSLFFVPVLDLKSRRLVCSECGRIASSRPKRRPPRPPRRPGAPPPPRPARAILEKMLADLKKKMGK